MYDEISKRPYEDNKRIKYLGANPILVTSEIETDVTVKNPVKIARKNRKRKKVLGSNREREANARKLEQELVEEEEKRKHEMRRISVKALREAIDEQENAIKSRQERHKELMKKFSIELPGQNNEIDEFEFE